MRRTAILSDVFLYERQRQAFFLIQLLAQSEHDRREGRIVNHADARARFAKKLRRR